jgi:purine-cytosine permease-like protein
MGSTRPGSLTVALALASAVATSFGALVAAVSRAIRNATESALFILFSPFEQASCEPLCRNYNGGDFLGK